VLRFFYKALELNPTIVQDQVLLLILIKLLTMNKRNEYIYELVGIIRGRKSQEFKNRECFKLIVELSNKENIHFIQAFKDKVNNQI